VRWEASDPDSETLNYSLSISSDGGETWLPLDINLIETKFVLGTALLPESTSYLIKVRATDGVNTSEDVSDEVFTITAMTRQPLPGLLLIGLIVLGIIGLGMMVSAIIIFVRRRA
jgi:hypothetical protein